MRIGEISDGTKSRLLKRGCLSAHERHHWTFMHYNSSTKNIGNFLGADTKIWVTSNARQLCM